MDNTVEKRKRGRPKSDSLKFAETKKMYAVYLSPEDQAYLSTWGQDSMNGNIKEALELLKKFRPRGL